MITEPSRFQRWVFVPLIILAVVVVICYMVDQDFFEPIRLFGGQG